MNRAKARLDGMLKEYGQRGKLKAESLRLRMDLKTAGEDIKGLTERRDRLQLELERRTAAAAASAAAPDSGRKGLAEGLAAEEGARRESGAAKRRSGASADGGDGRDVQDALIELNEAIEEQETKADYHRERLAEVRAGFRLLA
jgi:hypothetical protein